MENAGILQHQKLIYRLAQVKLPVEYAQDQDTDQGGKQILRIQPAQPLFQIGKGAVLLFRPEGPVEKKTGQNKEKFHAEVAVPEAGVSSRKGRSVVNDDHKGEKDPEKLYTQVAVLFTFLCVLFFCMLFFCILFYCMLFFCVLYWHDLSLTFFSIPCLSRKGHPSLPAGPTYTPHKMVC